MSVTFQQKNLLNAATSTGASSAFTLDRPCRSFTFNKRIVGVFSALVISYEGTIDGSNWFQIGTDNAVTAAPTFIVDKPCLAIRANCTTFTGGTSVTVDVLAST